MERTIDHHELEKARGTYSLAIDVRSPGEFAEDHFAGALNIPVLDDAQRAEVGTLYKQNSFAARKLGARYATEAIGRFLASETMGEAGKGTRFLVYCARGGQRSGALSTVLSQIGYPVFRLRQGYKTYRAYVSAVLARPLPGPVYVLHGYTGSQKTSILHALAGEVNVLDLEGAACHRGSILGGLPDRPQPAQRAFETVLLESLRGFDPAKPTLIEGESSKIGRLAVPAEIWRQMGASVRLWLPMPRAQRVVHILAEYRELQDPDYLTPLLAKLARYLSQQRMAALTEAMGQERWDQVVDQLLEHHYDPLYGRSLSRSEGTVIEAADIDHALIQIRSILKVAVSDS